MTLPDDWRHDREIGAQLGATLGEPFVSDDVHLVVQVEAIAP